MGEIKTITNEEIIESINENVEGVDTTKDGKARDMVGMVRCNTICSRMVIDECCVDEDGFFSYTIKFVDINGDEKKVTIPCEEFTEANIRKKITARGGYVFDPKFMYDYLKQQEAYSLGYREVTNNRIHIHPIVMKRIYKKAGWIVLENGDVAFVSSKGCYTKDGYQENTEYVGKLRIDQEGSLQEIKDMIGKYIIDEKNYALQAILAIAAASVLLWFFNKVFHKRILNFLVHLSGTPGTGKTTSLELCASFSGYPSIDSDINATSVYSTFNSTDGALTNLDFNNGYPVAIDDTQLCENKLKYSVFYALALGQSRQHLKSNGKRADVNSEYETGIVTSGEKGIFSVLHEEGLKPRIIELDDISWTQSPAASDAIQNTVLKNYGLLAPLIAEHLIDTMCEKDKLLSSFSRWERKFLKDAEDKHYSVHDTPRFVKTLALFMVSLEVLGEVLGQKYDINSVYNFFFDKVVVIKALEEQDSQDAYKHLVKYIIDHPEMFFADESAILGVTLGEPHDVCQDDIVGKIMKNSSKIKARVNGGEYSVFVKKGDALYLFIKQFGVRDFKRFLEDMLDDEKLIWTEEVNSKNGKKPRLDVRETLGGEIERGYRFVLPDDIHEKAREAYNNKFTDKVCQDPQLDD